jgi:hypothetical protein
MKTHDTKIDLLYYGHYESMTSRAANMIAWDYLTQDFFVALQLLECFSRVICVFSSSKYVLIVVNQLI